MTSILDTIAPKSDQLNADDLISGDKVITVTSVVVSGPEQDQPVSIHYAGDNGRPYKPCKTMRRVIVALWGGNHLEYIGRSMQLFNDNTVTYGAAQTGGIRIRAMSDIAQDEVKLAITVKRGKKEMRSIKRLSPADNTEVFSAAMEAAKRGKADLTAWWNGDGAKPCGAGLIRDTLTQDQMAHVRGQLKRNNEANQ